MFDNKHSYFDSFIWIRIFKEIQANLIISFVRNFFISLPNVLISPNYLDSVSCVGFNGISFLSRLFFSNKNFDLRCESFFFWHLEQTAGNERKGVWKMTTNTHRPSGGKIMIKLKKKHPSKRESSVIANERGRKLEMGWRRKRVEKRQGDNILITPSDMFT